MVTDVLRGNCLTAPYRDGGFSDANAVHDDRLVRGEIVGCKLVLGRHVGYQYHGAGVHSNFFAFFQIAQRD
jgi:hypothetical protein